MVQKSLCKWVQGTFWSAHSWLGGEECAGTRGADPRARASNPATHICAMRRRVGGRQEFAAANQRLPRVLTLSTARPLAGCRVALRCPRAYPRCPDCPHCPHCSRGQILLRPPITGCHVAPPAVHSSHAPSYSKKCSNTVFHVRIQKNTSK